MVDKNSPLFSLNNPKEFPAPTTEIVKDYLYSNTLTAIWGVPESGKSHIAVDMACTIAQKHPVIYVAAEAPSEIGNKATAWKEYHNTSLSNLYGWKEPLLLLDKKSVEIFIVTIAPKKPVAIFIDPLAQCFEGGNASSEEHMTMATNNMTHIMQTLDVGILLVAHPGKSIGKGIRGSSVLPGFYRLGFSVAKEGEIITIRCEKRNEGLKPQDRCFTIKQYGDDYKSTILHSHLKQSEIDSISLPVKLNYTQKLILITTCLEVFENGITKQALKNYMESTYGINEKTAYRNISDLIKLELIENQSINTIIISDKGKEIGQILTTSVGGSLSDGVILNWNVTDSHDSHSTILKFPNVSVS